MNCLPIFSRGLAAAALALSLAACAGTGPGAPAAAPNKDALVSLNDTFRTTYRETRAWRLSRLDPIIIVLIAAGFISWTFMWIPINILTGSRMIFAWAFDRVVPERLADVSDRTHTPVLAISLITGAALVFWAIWTFTGAYFLTSFIMMGFFGVFVTSIGAALFPYRGKAMYEASPIGGYKVLGLPLITVLGVINALFFGAMAVFAATNADYGANTPAAWITFAAVYVTGFIVFFVSKALRRSQDQIDLELLYREIPPE